MVIGQRFYRRLNFDKSVIIIPVEQDINVCKKCKIRKVEMAGMKAKVFNQ